MKEKEQKMGLYSIHSNPVCSNEFIVTGEDRFIRLYDKRKVSQGDPLKKFCPQNLVSGEVSKQRWVGDVPVNSNSKSLCILFGYKEWLSKLQCNER